jgi:hypothetical protein
VNGIFIYLCGSDPLNFAVNVTDVAVTIYFGFAADYFNGVITSACLVLSASICINIHLTALSRVSTNRINSE